MPRAPVKMESLCEFPLLWPFAEPQRFCQR